MTNHPDRIRAAVTGEDRPDDSDWVNWTLALLDDREVLMAACEFAIGGVKLLGSDWGDEAEEVLSSALRKAKGGA